MIINRLLRIWCEFVISLIQFCLHYPYRVGQPWIYLFSVYKFERGPYEERLMPFRTTLACRCRRTNPPSSALEVDDQPVDLSVSLAEKRTNQLLTTMKENKFKCFIKPCHLLALLLVQSFASNIEDNFWTATIRWLIVECAGLFLLDGVYYRCSVVPNIVLEPQLK